MKRFLLCFLLLSFKKEGYGQNNYNCSELMCILSKEWKEDSTGNGGFRQANTKSILDCKPDNLTKEFILQTLGKPNKVQKLYKGYQLQYYFYDARTLSKGEDGPLACWYVYFISAKGKILFY